MSMSRTSKPVETCQVCGVSDLTSILFLGYMRPGNMMRRMDAPPEEEIFYPLELLRCANCTLVQLGLEVKPQVIFPVDFPYRTGNTRALRDNFADLAREAGSLLALSGGDLVIDIGSNDGTLLTNFQSLRCRVLGIEPSGAAEDAEARGIPTRMAFFDRSIADEVGRDVGLAKLITCTNTFAHMPRIVSILEAVVSLLEQRGVFVSESHYLGDLIETLQYDTIYHEHLRYYSLGSLSYLLSLGGLEVFHVTRIPTHGGSIRVYAARPGQFEVDPSVTELLDYETRMGLSDGTALEDFRARVVGSKVDLLALLSEIIDDRTRIYGIGAAVRASTLIGYTGIDNGVLDCVLEVAGSEKLNHYMPGTRIPVLNEEKLIADQPEFALLLSWHIADHLIANLQQQGFKGKFIVPLPQPQIATD